MTLTVNTYPDRTMDIPPEESDIIVQAIRFHMKRHNLKPHDSRPDKWFSEASNGTVILRTMTKEIARYRYKLFGKCQFDTEQPATETPHGELISAAIASYRHRCKRRGDVYQQPSPDYSDVKDGIIILRNRYGEIARYKQNKDRNRLEYVVAP